MTKTYDSQCQEHGDLGTGFHADGTNLGEGLFYCPSGGGHVFSGRELERCGDCCDTSGMVRFPDSDKPSLWHTCDHKGGCTCCPDAAPAIDPVSIVGPVVPVLPEGVAYDDGMLVTGFPDISVVADAAYFQRTDKIVRFSFWNGDKMVMSLCVLNPAKVIEVPARPDEEPTDG